MELIPHLFRTESRKITAVLCKVFGVEHIDIAEDLVSETFLSALETWPYKGIPENPTAWLYRVAKNKTWNYIQRDHLFRSKIAAGAFGESGSFDLDLSEANTLDSQLQMLFALCHPSLPAEAQIGLSLRILCGFGITEIADAFLTTKEVINKRLYRAKEKLRAGKIPIEFPGDPLARLPPVLATLYLLFNEGYYSESRDVVLREDLCLEAMRLTWLLLENPSTNQPDVRALFSLMCFHASRFPARKDENGEIVLYADQDESKWNQELIARGAWYLHQASVGDTLSRYHLEASIAYWNTQKADTPEKWENILQMYNRLLQIVYSPMAALNRTYALSKARDATVAIAAAEKLGLEDNPYYHTLLGVLYTGINDVEARQHLEKALSLARTQTDRKTIQKRLDAL